MSDLIYPDLPGIKPVVRRSPEWKTVPKEAWNGEETMIAQRAYPRWIYTLSYEVLRSDAAIAERAQLMAFYNKHRGSFADFLYRDEEDNAVADQAFGITDGVATQYQLVRSIADWLEPCWAPDVAGLSIKRADTPLAIGIDYMLGSRGQVQLMAPGDPGETLTWTGTYCMRVRFLKDSIDFERFLQGLWQTGSIELYSKVYA